MHKPDPVETILARLMPAAMSDVGQSDIEAMLDELAGPLEEIHSIKRWFHQPWVRGIAGTGIAAAVLLSLTVSRPIAPSPAVSAGGHEAAVPGFVLVGESGTIQSMSAEGWREDSDGSAMRTLHMSVVEENRILDEQTGIVMLVSEPREEYLLMPVSAF